MFSLFDMFLSFGEGGKRLSKYLAESLGRLEFKNWKQPHIPVLALNFSDDATDIVVESELVENVGGTGRVAEKAIEIYKSNGERIKSWLWNNMNKTIPNRIWVSAGLGGGVGTGSIILGLRDLFSWIESYKEQTGHEYKPTVYILLTIPKKDEGAKLRKTALKYLNELIRDYIKSGKVSGTLLIDNTTAESLYGGSKNKGMWEDINEGIFKALERFYTLPMREDIDWTTGYKRYDFNDLLSSLSYGSGFMDIREADLSYEQLATYISHKQNQEPANPSAIETRSLLCSSHDINTVKRFSILVGIPKSWVTSEDVKSYVYDYAEHVIRSITRKAHCSEYINTSYIDGSIENMSVTIICSGMPLSTKMNRMIQSIAKDLQKDKEKEGVKELDLTVLEEL